jgi:hypothetical protein
MISTYPAGPDVDVVTSGIEVPGMGTIPVNAFVLRAEQPVLVDTGTVIESDEFMKVLESVIDPSELRWIWLTHTDFDHIGSLHRLLARNQRLRVVTSFLGVGIMGLSAPLPLDRVYLINDGQRLDVGDRTLTAVKPPTFDNPVTTGFRDDKSGAFFSADCFGAVLPSVPERAADIGAEELRQGQIAWATVDSPWLHRIDPAALGRDLDRVRALEPTVVLSSHLPPAGAEMTETLLAAVEAAPTAPPFVGPDQAALETILAEMAGSPPA